MSSVQDRSLALAINASLEFPLVIPRVLSDLRKRQQQPIEYIPTPFPTLHSACVGTGGGLGFGQGDYILTVGPTGKGKSSFALNCAWSAMLAGIDTHFISLELSRDVILTRLRSIVSGQDTILVQRGDGFDPVAAEKADDAILSLEGRLFVNEIPIYDIRDIAGAVGELVRSEGVRFAILDYVGLVSTAGRDSELYARMSEVSAKLAMVARTTGVTIMALSQFNRALAPGEEPHVNQIFGSSRLGFDPDLVIALDYSKTDRDTIRRITRLRLKTLKSNHGPPVHFPIEYSTRTLRFREVEYGEGAS